MRIFRFLLQELGLRGVVFTLVSTIALVSLYLLSIGAPPEDFGKAAQSFLLFVSGSPEFSTEKAGFSASVIVSSGAAITFPLAMVSLFFICVIALVSASVSASSTHLAQDHGEQAGLHINKVVGVLASMIAAIPLFVGYGLLYGAYGLEPPFILIALITVAVGGLGWDAARFLIQDMKRQIDTTHTMVFSTLGPPAGRLFPFPGTITGYLLNSSAPRFIPYLAGKVPAIIGAVTIAEVAFSFPGLGRTLLDALIEKNTSLVIATVFVLLAVNALVILLVKTVLFIMYPRWYEKAI